MSGGIRRRVDDISKQFTGAGWKGLPQELVDEILAYLLDDLDALKSCSLTCKFLFGAARPLIHRRLVCLDSRPAHPKPMRSLFSRHKSGAFERLTDADRSGTIRYTRHLTFKPIVNFPKPSFEPTDMQEYLPRLRSITKLHTLTLDTFHVHLFVPIFNEHFGMFANTLRHLDIRNAYGSERDLLYIICQFPLLEDLTIVSPAGAIIADPEHPIPIITQSPPLRGKLVLAWAYSTELIDGLAAFPHGLNFRSLELFQRGDPRVVLAACGHTSTSISYHWRARGGNDSKSDPSILVAIVM